MTEPKGFGRHFSPDERDLNHLIPRRAIPSLPVRKTWSGGKVLDQGDTPQCVGYAGWGWLSGGPILNKPKFSPTDLYHEAQKRDEWPGEDYEGSSTRGLFKALTDLGFVSGFQWAFDVEPIIAHVLTVGPVCVGTDWYAGMTDPDAKGFLNTTGAIQGGHEWRIVGADREKRATDGTVGAFRMVNSWGLGWGDGGRAYVSFATVDRLIKQNGEACTAKEVLK
jgi:hypothetical protein